MCLVGSICELSNTFADYYIYPISSFDKTSSPVHVLLNQEHPLFSDEHYYKKQLQLFLQYHTYEPIKIGADLPWWGEKYFSEEPGLRIMVITQDSKSEDAGSVTFYAHLMKDMSDSEYKDYIKQFDSPFPSWYLAKSFFNECHLNFDFLYITDSRKVYPKGSLDNRHDKKKREKLLKGNKFENRHLLKREIQICQPDVILILGKPGMEVLDILKGPESLGTFLNRKDTSFFLTDNEGFWNGGIYCIAAPFPTVGKGYNYFQENKGNAIQTIREFIRQQQSFEK